MGVTERQTAARTGQNVHRLHANQAGRREPMWILKIACQDFLPVALKQPVLVANLTPTNVEACLVSLVPMASLMSVLCGTPKQHRPQRMLGITRLPAQQTRT